MKKALVTGITGQDGSYLAELLLEKGYEVVGLVRRTSVCNLERLKDLIKNPKVTLVEGEVCDPLSVYSIVENGNFDEIYNLAAQSHVGTSFDQPSYTFDVDAKGPLNFLESIRKYSPRTKFYQASTSELFGQNFTYRPHPDIPPVNHSSLSEMGKHLLKEEPTATYQDEDTPFAPQSPYACAKLAAHDLVRIYREGYGLHASCGILFNHESERRGEKFVTRKITKWLADFYHWFERVEGETPQRWSCLDTRDEDQVFWDLGVSFPKLRLGNLDAYRDWGHAEDYVRAMWIMLQCEEPDDYVIATGETCSVRGFLERAFNEIGITDFEPYVVIDPKFYRPAEVEYLCGRAHKAKTALGWETEISFDELVHRMVWSDINGSKKKEQACCKG